MIKNFLNKLNGWQRIFVFVSVLWISCYGLFLRPGPKWVAETAYLYEFLPHGNKSESLSDLFEESSKNEPYIASDGTSHLMFSEYSDVQKKEAEEKSKSKAKLENTRVLRESIFVDISITFLPLILIYAFGFMVSWIIDGFKSKKS